MIMTGTVSKKCITSPHFYYPCIHHPGTHLSTEQWKVLQTYATKWSNERPEGLQPCNPYHHKLERTPNIYLHNNVSSPISAQNLQATEVLKGMLLAVQLLLPPAYVHTICYIYEYS